MNADGVLKKSPMMSNFEMIYLWTQSNISGVWVSPTIEIFLVDVILCPICVYKQPNQEQ